MLIHKHHTCYALSTVSRCFILDLLSVHHQQSNVITSRCSTTALCPRLVSCFTKVVHLLVTVAGYYLHHDFISEGQYLVTCDEMGDDWCVRQSQSLILEVGLP